MGARAWVCASRLKPIECHIYLDGQRYFIRVVLDISRKAIVVSIVVFALSQRLLIAQHHHCCRHSDPSPLFIAVYIIYNNASGVWPIDALAGGGGDLQAIAHSSAVRSCPGVIKYFVIGTVRLISNIMLKTINRAKHQQPHTTPSRGFLSRL